MMNHRVTRPVRPTRTHAVRHAWKDNSRAPSQEIFWNVYKTVWRVLSNFPIDIKGQGGWEIVLVRFFCPVAVRTDKKRETCLRCPHETKNSFTLFALRQKARGWSRGTFVIDKLEWNHLFIENQAPKPKKKSILSGFFVRGCRLFTHPHTSWREKCIHNLRASSSNLESQS